MHVIIPEAGVLNLYLRVEYRHAEGTDYQVSFIHIYPTLQTAMEKRQRLGSMWWSELDSPRQMALLAAIDDAIAKERKMRDVLGLTTFGVAGD